MYLRKRARDATLATHQPIAPERTAGMYSGGNGDGTNVEIPGDAEKRRMDQTTRSVDLAGPIYVVAFVLRGLLLSVESLAYPTTEPPLP